MEITEFRRVLSAFAEEPSDVDVRLGKVVAQIRDEVIDASIAFSEDGERRLLIVENGQKYPVRSWVFNRVARLPQLADRIIVSATPTAEIEAKSPFVVPAGRLSPDLSNTSNSDECDVPDTVAAIMRKVVSPVPGATSVMYLTSDAGEGKTTIINHVARLQAQRFKDKAASSLVVPIPLSGRAFLNFDDAVIAALVNKLRFNYLYFNAFIELVRLGAVIPAFDGYEEMMVEGSKGEAISALGNLVQTLDSSGTIFIAARKAFFDYISFKTQARLLDAIGNRSASFSRLEIVRWDRQRFCDYGILRSVDQPEEIYETVAARLGPEHPMLTRAVLIRRLFDVATGISDRSQLGAMLGSNPQDYFFTFVDAIVKREASEKWLARVSVDVMEPLLTIDEHHQLLGLLAQEMWVTSTNSLRHDVLDVLVDIFAEGHKKSAAVTRQIKERLKQHSLLASDSTRGQALAFDHEDFQNFYLGEGLGALLARGARAELQTFLSVNLVPAATVEQAVSALLRNKVDVAPALQLVLTVNEAETGYSFCKENCGALAVRLAECERTRAEPVVLRGLLCPPGALAGRTLRQVQFVGCHFQPSAVAAGTFGKVLFRECEFERLEVEAAEALVGSEFSQCRVDSMLIASQDEQTFDPERIDEVMRSVGVLRADGLQPSIHSRSVGARDGNFKLLERFLRVFLRTTFVDEDVIRLRLGGVGASGFFDHVLPALVERSVLAEVQWKGQGVKKRYRLLVPMSEISRALERSKGNFDAFISLVDEAQ